MPHPLIDDWIAYHAAGGRASDPRFAAWAEVDDLVRLDPENGMVRDSRAHRRYPDDRVLANVAAGPLERPA